MEGVYVCPRTPVPCFAAHTGVDFDYPKGAQLGLFAAIMSVGSLVVCLLVAGAPLHRTLALIRVPPI
jgi:hypothetical protein